MKRKLIICISIFGFIAAVLLSNVKEIQNKEYISEKMKQSKNQLEEKETVNLFMYLPVE